MLVRRFLVWQLIAGALFNCAEAAVLPWSTSQKIDPRDAAFGPITVTPTATAIPWGTPLEKGPVRVLFIAPRFAMRDAAELAARLDVEIETVALWDANSFGRPEDDSSRTLPGTSAQELVDELHRKLDKKLDLIIAANFDFAAIPPETFQSITDKVRAGTGLLLAHHRHTLPDALREFLDGVEEDSAVELVTHGVGEKLTGEWSAGLGFVRTGTTGEGRVVELDLQGERPAYHALIPSLSNPQVFENEHFDTYMSLVCRAARWAAGRDIPTVIDRVESTKLQGPEAVQIPPGLEEMVDANLPPGASMFHPYRLHLRAPADRTYTVRTQVRQSGRGAPPITNTWKNQLLKKGAQSYDFYVIAGAGEYWLDVWLLDKNNVVEWYSETLSIDAWPSIADLSIQKAVVQPHDSVGLTFVMPARKRPCIALARATDTFGRVVAETHQPIAPDTAYVKIGLKFSDLIADLLKVEVFVSDRNLPMMPVWDTRLCAYEHRYLSVRGVPESDRFDVITDVTGSVEYNARAVYTSLLNEGFSAAAVPALEESVRTIAQQGLATIPRVASYAPASSAPGLVRMPCLSDPAFMQREQERLGTVVQSVKDYTALAYSLGESNAVSPLTDDVCRAPASLAAFRDYLQKHYGDLNVLNRAWGTAYQTWEPITPPTLEAVRAEKNYAPWVDFRLFMDSEFLATHVRARTLVRTADLRARVGAMLAHWQNPFSGIDLTGFASNLDMLSVPANAFLLAHARSGRPPQSMTAVTFPTEPVSADMLRWLPWFSVLHGAQAVWWPDTTATTTRIPAGVSVDPMANPVAYAPEFFSEVDTIQSGLDALLLRSVRHNSGIAILSSRPSTWLNVADTQFTELANTAEAFANVLATAGYGYDIITPEQLIKGRLTAYRVVILPMARAMSDAEIHAVIAFHAAGGCVIADVAPGAFTEHGTRREASGMEAMFGVRRAKPSAAGESVHALVELSIGDAKASAEFDGVRADIGVEPVNGLVGGIAGKAPIWLTLRENAGRAVLLNHAADAAQLRTATGLLGAILHESGAKPLVEVETRANKPFRGERFSFAFGDATIVALLADAHAEDDDVQKFNLRFDRDRHVYNLYTRTAEMRPTNINVELVRGGAGLYSVLPYEIRQCVLTAPPSAMVGARIPLHVSLESDGTTPGDHLVRIEVYALRTEGIVPLSHYFTNIVCAGGEGDGYIPLALDERLGSYRIVARDLLTGARGEAIVTLAKAQQV